MKIMLNSEKIGIDDLFSLEAFLNDVSLTDLLLINKMIIEETNKRVEIVDKRKMCGRLVK